MFWILQLLLTFEQTTKQISSQMFIPHAFEAIASTSGGIQPLIDRLMD